MQTANLAREPEKACTKYVREDLASCNVRVLGSSSSWRSRSAAGSYFLGVAGVVVAIGWRLLAPFQPRAEGFDLDCPHPHLLHCDGGCLGDAHDNNSHR